VSIPSHPSRRARAAALLVGACLALALLPFHAQGRPTEPTPPNPKAGGSYGTNVKFLSNPAAAARKAAKAEKLLFLLHISGNFEDAGFT
jgi:hypothetical protein